MCDREMYFIQCDVPQLKISLLLSLLKNLNFNLKVSTLVVIWAWQFRVNGALNLLFTSVSFTLVMSSH